MPETTAAETTLILEQVRPELVGAATSKIPELVEKACRFSGGRFAPETVLAACSGQHPLLKWQMWLVFDPRADAQTFGKSVKVMVVTNIARYPTGIRVAEVILIAGRGDSSEWMQYIDALKDWARNQDCERIQFIGRRGFQRKLGPAWREVSTMYEFDLKEPGDGQHQQRN